MLKLVIESSAISVVKAGSILRFTLFGQTVMDRIDAEKFATVYRELAAVLDREHSDEHLTHRFGDLMRRVFVGTQFDPPDELLESTAETLRSNDTDNRRAMAKRLREHATHLDKHAAQHES